MKKSGLSGLIAAGIVAVLALTAGSEIAFAKGGGGSAGTKRQFVGTRAKISATHKGVGTGTKKSSTNQERKNAIPKAGPGDVPPPQHDPNGVN